MDALSEVLRSARLSGGVFLKGDFTEPWCLSSAVTAGDCSRYLGSADHLILYHYVIEGALTITTDAGPPVTFRPGQVAILPRNDPHTMSGREPAAPVSALDANRIPGPEDLMMIEHGGGGAPTRIMCGFLGGPALAGDPLFTALPDLLIYDCASARSGPVVRASLEYAAEEIANAREGTDAMLARLSELLFVEAVRDHIESLAESTDGWIGAFKDRTMSRALAELHADPARAWTVEQLARVTATSRSALADRFVRYTGCAPMEFLTQHRLRLAARELALTAAPLIEIADSVGYGSEAAFSRAFKRVYGVAPSVWRQNNR